MERLLRDFDVPGLSHGANSATSREDPVGIRLGNVTG